MEYFNEKVMLLQVDESRRWILSRVLGIPPVLLGLSQPFLSPEITQQENIFTSLHSEAIDIEEYKAALVKYCHSFLSGDTLEQLQDIQRRIQKLQIAIHYTPPPEKRAMQRLLCEYVALLGVSAHEQRFFGKAIALLSDALFVAKQNKFYDIQAYTLRQRGISYMERGELLEGLIHFAPARADFERAVLDFAAARKLQKFLSPLRYGLVLDAAGRAYAHIAQNEQQFSEALGLVDDGAKMIGKDGDEITIPSRFSEERHLLSRGETLLASSVASLRYPAQARKELERATMLTQPSFKLRHIENYTRQAEAYYLEGQIPRANSYRPDEAFVMAASYGEAVLELLQTTPCAQYLIRLENLYWRLSESQYGKNEAVALFGVALLKQQHPGFFPQLN